MTPMSGAVVEVDDWSGSSLDHGAPPALTNKINTHEPVANRQSLRDISAIITYLAEDLFCSGEHMHPLPARMPSVSPFLWIVSFIYLFF